MKGCRPLSEVELDRLLKAMSGKYVARLQALFILGVVTGYRISELLSLTINDVWQYGQVSSHISVRRGKMKGKKEGRTVPLNTKVRPYLREWVRQSLAEGRQGTDPLFWSQKNPADAITPRQASREIVAAAKKARLSGTISTHSMRKTFVDRIYPLLNGDIFKIQQAMGHKSPMSTVAYLSFKQSEVDAAILADD
jgi:integrase